MKDYLVFAHDLGYLEDVESLATQVDAISRMQCGLIASIRSRRH